MAEQMFDGAVQFTITNNQVTAEQAVRGSHVFNVPIPSKATFLVGDGSVTETIVQKGETEVLQFTADPTKPSLYHLSSITETITNPTTTDSHGGVHGINFIIMDGVVTGAQEVTGSSATNTHSHDIRLDPGAHYATSGSSIIETRIDGATIQTLQFDQVGSAGLYALSSKLTTFVPPGAATTHLSVNTADRLEFTFDAGGGVTAIQRVHADGSTTTLTPDSHATFAQTAPGFVVETVTHGSQVSYEVFHDGNGDGVYTETAHGVGALDLAGLQTQLIPAVEAFL